MKRKFTTIAIIASLLIGCQGTMERPYQGTAKPSQPSRKIKKIDVQTDYGVRLTASVDAATETATYSYEIKNVSKMPRELWVTHPALAGQKRVMKIEPQKTQELKIDTRIKAVKISPEVRLIRLKPYLLLPADDKKKERLLISKYKVNLKVSVPKNARVLKSTVPFKAVSPGLLQWKMDDIAILPPVDLWYTIAPDQLEVSAETTDESGRATITIEITNTGSNMVRNISLRTRIPMTLYYSVPDLSDGKFELQQGIVYIWHAKVNSISVNQVKTMKIVLDKINKTAPMKNLEVRVYNQRNELLAIEQTTAATPFFGN